ncbi:MAG: DUF4249 domain-containing protein [Bacteroidota bacterium]
MHRNRQLIWILALAFLGTGCQNFFSTTLKVDPPDHEDQLVLHAFLSDTDSIVLASVTRSFALLEDIKEDQDYITDATVSLFRDGEKVGDLDALSDEFRPYNYGIITDATKGQNGSTFEIRVEHPTLGTATAQATMPKHVPITKMEFTKDAILDEFGERSDVVDITFVDPGGERNFYEFALVFTDTLSSGRVYFNQVYTFFTDPNIRDGVNYEYNLLNDDTFDGREYQFRLSANTLDFSEDIYLIWRSVSESSFLYSKSVLNQLDARDLGTFADPVSVFSNVNNGLGVLGIKSEQLYRLDN